MDLKTWTGPGEPRQPSLGLTGPARSQQDNDRNRRRNLQNQAATTSILERTSLNFLWAGGRAEPFLGSLLVLAPSLQPFGFSLGSAFLTRFLGSPSWLGFLVLKFSSPVSLLPVYRSPFAHFCSGFFGSGSASPFSVRRAGLRSAFFGF